MAEPNVRVVKPDDEASVVAALVLGFSADPVLRWLFRDGDAYLRSFAEMVRIMAKPAVEHGSGFLVETAGTVSAACLWNPPGVRASAEAMGQLMAAAVPNADQPERFAFFGQLAEAHPDDDDEPHWYLPVIAVDPSAQGRGHGSALLRRALERVDADGLPAYLESSNAANIPLYARFGFEVTGEIQVGGSPTMWPMWRPGR